MATVLQVGAEVLQPDQRSAIGIKDGEKMPTTNDLDKVGKTMPSSVSDRMARGEKKGHSLVQNLILPIIVMFRQSKRFSAGIVHKD